MGLEKIYVLLNEAKVDRSRYEETRLEINGTQFLILGRPDGLGTNRIQKAVKRAWPMYSKWLGSRVRAAGVVDFDFPIGGGPLVLGKSFLVGIYSSNNISHELQEFVNSVTEWGRHPSTARYIETHYRQHPDPIQAYVDEIVFHELGHLYFGFGLTDTSFGDISESWFALGIGIIYDRRIWRVFYKGEGPLIDACVRIWRDRFASNPEVDQRLIRPDVTNDTRFGLNRTQTYGHGKAFKFLEALMDEVSEAVFDRAVNDLLTFEAGNKVTYDLFLKYLKSPETATKIALVERTFMVR